MPAKLTGQLLSVISLKVFTKNLPRYKKKRLCKDTTTDWQDILQKSKTATIATSLIQEICTAKIDTKKVIGKYNCKLDDCDIYENAIFNPIYDNKFIVLKENNKVFIYDYRLNIITSEYYDEIIDKKDNYFIVKLNNHTCLIDIEGNNLIPCDYDEIIINNKYNNLVKVKLNDKYGIYDIKNNLLLIDTLYEDLDITDINYYKVYKDNLWYVIDKNNNIITNGYSYIYPFNKGFIALIDNKLEILKYSLNEELLNDTIIEVQDNNYKISLNNSILTIETDKVYEYEVNRNILKIK